jgi:hypothetical protein
MNLKKINPLTGRFWPTDHGLVDWWPIGYSRRKARRFGLLARLAAERGPNRPGQAMPRRVPGRSPRALHQPRRGHRWRASRLHAGALAVGAPERRGHLARQEEGTTAHRASAASTAVGFISSRRHCGRFR